MNTYNLLREEVLEHDGLNYNLPVQVGNILNSVNQNLKFEMNKEYQYEIDASVGEKFITCIYIGNKLNAGKVISQLQVIRTSHRPFYN